MGAEVGIGTLAELGLTAMGAQEAQITGLSVDSRLVKDGHLFAALPGVTAHGGDFIQYALRQGAAAILTDQKGAEIAKKEIEASGAALVIAQDPRQALAFAATLWFGAQPEIAVAVTGTNGKTSVASFTRQIWALLGFEAANVGTTGVEGAYSAPTGHTTPEPITLHRLMADMAHHGITHVAMEASSHGLEQRRLDGMQLAAAGFTNFTQDHLDYHADFEAYFNAKAGLFTRVLSEDGIAVVNRNDARFQDISRLAEKRGQEVLSVGRDENASIRIIAQRFEPMGQTVLFEYNDRTFEVKLPLIGGFQAENVLMAAGLAIASGADANEIFGVLPQLKTVRGRMELAATRKNGASIFVDYAHTPDALATACRALRPHVLGRLIVVFGAGGDRDKGKRPLMGQAAEAHADVIFVTDDNPRSEDPAVIRREVMDGCIEAIEVADRAEAILRGVDALGAGDVLLIAGKGHETGQVIGDDVLPFDDLEQASVAVAALDGML
ncbi:UDP-N-acetylmuramoylalanyl-D-glutamate--2,6-diaminopimelate ligase [Rhodobacterales bacterium HTCC2150]|nr:UDP-N-acetylmuramoylalanyl-D-glutamate--2,6-diaminopimelate ligase [Rhodobacterales bacterium HTCC2150] [Rhodobacteraceae bacterium HTCC2150]